jgi:hypothetical protein
LACRHPRPDLFDQSLDPISEDFLVARRILQSMSSNVLDRRTINLDRFIDFAECLFDTAKERFAQARSQTAAWQTQ